jgi:hypothetical protein
MVGEGRGEHKFSGGEWHGKAGGEESGDGAEGFHGGVRLNVRIGALAIGICFTRAGVFRRATMLYHCVYFWLKPELTAEQRAEFRRGVESLKEIKSVEHVSVGVPAGTTRRPVIDSSYDVALVVACKNVAAEAAYQVDPLHLAFVDKFKTFWTRVQIYDSE